MADECDVLIIGAGPAGLMLGCWLARTGVKARIIDQRATKITRGHADGVQCRTIEIFQSFGMAERIQMEANELSEVVFYSPDKDGNLVPTSRIPDTEPDTSRFRHSVLNQGRIEDFLIDCMKTGGLAVERLMSPLSLEYSDSPTESHPITVKIEHLVPIEDSSDPASGLYRSNIISDEEFNRSRLRGGKVENIKAKYVVGCDGARSWTRKYVVLRIIYAAHRFPDNSDTPWRATRPTFIYWGVMDARPITDLPDIRVKVVLHSANAGSLMIVPRERNLVRFYIQLGALQPGEKIGVSAQSPEKIIESARKILAPYTLECPEVEWWSVYEIGQRICKTVSSKDRVFLAGDAFHTHSPKGGQGMNVSMMDSYNLGWKLAACVKGLTSPSILDTYGQERVEVARQLIEFDHKFSRLFSATPAVAESEGVSMEEFQALWVRMGKWTSGTAVRYDPSLIMTASSPAKTELVQNVIIGSHFESQMVVCYADAHATQFADRLVSDGRWRLIVFAGNMGDENQLQRFNYLCDQLMHADESPIKKYTPPSADLNSVIEVLTLTSSSRRVLSYSAFPELARPYVGKFRYPTYDQIFSDEVSYLDGGGTAYSGYGVDPDGPGCVVLVRPDQFIADVLGFEQCVENLAIFFDGFMVKGK
ncbi:FAD binding domain-containing protein [Mycena alexandri]|uniref:FAD binding domain-containing protein n=1 Tax=Mycena alexandri TaxID=1745969 RepID=A0AAD6WKT2_9AGAR|nr:FAD binding domain-containing protein [Mycena alexandri]